MTRSGEFELIARYFAPLSRKAPLAFALTDDAATLRPRAGHDLVLTTDTIIAGVHFLPDDPPEAIGQKLLRVNLSDLAAKGAAPRAYLMNCTFPSDVSEDWIAAFTRGLAADQAEFGISLIGGDTTATTGPLTLSATAIGVRLLCISAPSSPGLRRAIPTSWDCTRRARRETHGIPAPPSLPSPGACPVLSPG